MINNNEDRQEEFYRDLTARDITDSSQCNTIKYKYETMEDFLNSTEYEEHEKNLRFKNPSCRVTVVLPSS